MDISTIIALSFFGIGVVLGFWSFQVFFSVKVIEKITPDDEKAKQLREALRTYGKHKMRCSAWMDNSAYCTCGFWKAANVGVLDEPTDKQNTTPKSY